MTRFGVPVFLLTVLTLGCGSQVCTTDARIGLHVVIEGAEADDDVSVVAVEDDFSEELDCVVSDGDHECSGLTERPGTYVVTATLNGASQAKSITLADDGCHVVTQTVPFFAD